VFCEERENVPANQMVRSCLNDRVAAIQRVSGLSAIVGVNDRFERLARQGTQSRMNKTRPASLTGLLLRGLNLDFRFQRAVHWTFLSHFHEPPALLVAEIAFRRNGAFDPIYHPRLTFTFCAIHGVDPRVPQTDLCPFQGKLLAIRIEPQRHRGACSERCQQEFVRSRAAAESTYIFWLVCKQSVRPEMTSCWYLPSPVSWTTTVSSALSALD
jgi:hypothetical protein